MLLVIDGYNLMHALGMAPRPGHSLERSRMRFVEWLAVELGHRCGEVCLVFDSVTSIGGNEQMHRGVRMKFADARTADDQIEELIRAEAVPSRLTIISNDHRLQAAATRGGCLSWTCGEFVDWLQAGKKTPSEPAKAEVEEKPIVPSGSEIDEWLGRFGP